MIRAGQIWLETKQSRHVKILDPDYGDCAVSWTYCTPDGTPEPHDTGMYRYWFWHYCDSFDFLAWKRFVLVSEEVVQP